MDNLFVFVSTHWQLCAIFVIILTLLLINEFTMLKSQSELLSPQDVVLKMNNEEATLIDVRAQDLYKKEHIINSININKDEISQAKLNKYKNSPIIIVCMLGKTALTAAETLKKEGFQHVFVLEGGIEAWKGANLPLIKSK